MPSRRGEWIVPVIVVRSIRESHRWPKNDAKGENTGLWVKGDRTGCSGRMCRRLVGKAGEGKFWTG